LQYRRKNDDDNFNNNMHSYYVNFVFY